MYTLTSKKANFAITVPESLNEITPDILEKLTKDIKLPKHYCLVAFAYQTDSFELAFLGKKSGKQTIKVLPMLAKVTETFVENFKIGDGLIINRSDVEFATHCPIGTKANVSAMIDYIAADVELAKKCATKEVFFDAVGLEFKIVPETDIKGAFKVGYKIDDPFKVPVTNGSLS